MTTEDYIGTELRRKLRTLVPDFVIDKKVKEMILHYRKRGMVVMDGKTKKPIVEYFYQTAKKENKQVK